MKFAFAFIATIVLPFTLAAPAAQSKSPAPGTLGGICGGIAGFRCVEGLDCYIKPEDAHIADAAGVCRKCKYGYGSP